MYESKNVPLRYNAPTPAEKHNSSTLLSLYWVALATLFLVAQLARTISAPTEAQVFPGTSVSPSVAPTASITTTPSPTPEPTETPLPEGTDVASLIAQRPAIEQYIKTIFTHNWKTAYAVAFAESGRVDIETGEPYFRTYAVRRSGVEVSVGLFQINLKNEKTFIHYDRIPGNTEEQKIEWLKSPYNNALYAYWVYSESDWFPWTTYSDGKYLAYMR
jgi:hypothetical protein